MVTTFISSHKNKIRILWGVFAALCILTIIAFRSSKLVDDFAVPWKLGILSMPFFLFAALHLLLMYESWFGSDKGGAFAFLKRGFFLLLSVTYVVILIYFIGYFLISR